MRYSTVPWLEDTDLRPMGDPETSIDLPGEITHGLRIVAPFGGPDALLAVHAVMDTQRITLAITSTIRVEVRMDVNLHSNPRRAQGDGDTGED